MSELEFSLALERTNEEFEYSCKVAPGISPEIFAPHRLDGDIDLKVKYYVDYDAVLHLSGYLKVPCCFVCDRCGSKFEKNLFLDFNEEVGSRNSKDFEVTYSAPRLKLDSIVESYLITNFPTKVLCREDCKGLCPRCGTNLNEGMCSCFKDET